MIKPTSNHHKRQVNALFALAALFLFFAGLANYRSILTITDDLFNPADVQQQSNNMLKASPMDVNRALNELSRRH